MWKKMNNYSQTIVDEINTLKKYYTCLLNCHDSEEFYTYLGYVLGSLEFIDYYTNSVKRMSDETRVALLEEEKKNNN